MEVLVILRRTSRALGIALSLLVVALGVAYSRPFAYVAVRGGPFDSSGIAVIDLSTNTVIATLPIPAPEDIFAAPGGRRLFALSAFGADTASLIGTATNGLLASASVSGLAETRRAVAFSPEGCLTYVLASDRDSLTVLDAEARVTRSQIVTGRRPFAVAVSRDGLRVYVANSGSDSVTTIETATGTVLGTIRVGSNPRDIVVHPNGRTAYVVNAGAGTVSVVDLTTNTVIASPPISPSPNASLNIAPDGSRLYVASVATITSSAVTVISTSTNAVIGSISGNFSASSVPSLAFSLDSKRAYITELAGILVADVASNNVLGRVAINGPQRIALSPDGGRAYVTYSLGVAVVDTATLAVVARISVGATPVGIIVLDPPPLPAFTVAGLVNAAGFQPGAPLAAGEIAALFGKDLGPTDLVGASSLPLPTAMCGTSVSVGGVNAPLFYVSSAQLAIQVPYELTAAAASVRVSVNDAVSDPVNLTIAAASPGLFTFADGKNAIAQDFGPDGRSFFVVEAKSLDTFATGGDFLVFYLSGLGLTTPRVATNTPAPDTAPLAQAVEKPTISIGGRDVPVLFAGLTPGSVGLYQINVQLPADIAIGNAVPVVVFSAGRSSNVASLPVKAAVRSTGYAISTLAGSGVSGFNGDGGPALAAQLSGPAGIGVDSAGNAYIADTLNNRIRKVAATSSTISTLAGGSATKGQVDVFLPGGLTVDSAGNIFAANLEDVITKITPAGSISCFAHCGNAPRGFSGDGGPAVDAQLSHVLDVALDGAGNLFIADSGNLRIRRISATGVISTVAGNGSNGPRGDGGPAVSAQLGDPWGVAADSAGNLYIADFGNNEIRKVTTAGVISTIAGNGVGGYGGDGGPATAAKLNGPSDVTVDSQGNVYIADYGNQRIRKVTTMGVISTIAGNGVPGYGGDGGPASSAMLNGPWALTLDSAGNVFVADTGNNRIRKLTPQ